MSLDRYTTLHRKDERGVIVESKVFGPDDEIPEGFGNGEYTPVYAPREDDQAPVAESVLTPWSSPVATGTWVEQPEPEDIEALVANESPVDGGEDELDEGSPEQARQQAGEELTEAEKAALDAAGSDEGDDKPVDESDAGTPVQAQGEADSEQSVPPQGGPGSGKDAWAAYAASNGVTVESGATRDEIIAACEAAGVPVN